MAKGGYVGRIAHFDLTEGKVSEQKLPDDAILRKYIGGFGLGLHLVFDKIRPGMQATDPKVPMVFLTGPLSGLPVPGANNTTLTTLNAATGFTVIRSHTHGFWGVYLKHAGYDGIMIDGASDKPIYLVVTKDRLEIRDASKFWGVGLDTHDAEQVFRKEVGEPKASVAAIGPAGENLCSGAMICNDRNHSFSHGGVGKVAGAKKIKAIVVVDGGLPIPIANKVMFQEAAKQWQDNLFNSGLAAYLKDAGIPHKDYGGPRDYFEIMTVKNFLGTREDLPNYGVGMSRQKITPKPCFSCRVMCGYDIEMTEGEHADEVATPCGGGENTEGAGSIMGVEPPGAMYHLLELNDRLGLNSSSTGLSIAVAMEAWEKGLLTKEDTGGLELTWGNVQVIDTLLRQIANRDGFGAVLADGPKAAGERVGLPNAGVHVKGSPPNLHDWRNAWSVMLGQIVGGGVSWPAYGADVWTFEPDLGYTGLTNPTSPKDKAKEVAGTAAMKMAYFDSMGCCSFGVWGIPGVTGFAAQAIAGATGWEDWTREEQFLAGERIYTLERIFNLRMGCTAEDDFKNFSPRLLEAPQAGKAKGKTIAPYLEGMIRDYYAFLGWDRHSGKPFQATIGRLGLEEYAHYVWP